MDETFLIFFDADRIREYVFATGRLKDIRGASALVRKLTDRPAICELTGLSPWTESDTQGVIYAAGGAGALLVTGRERAEEICRKLEQTYRRETAGAVLSAVAVPVAALTPDGLVAARQSGLRALARRKSGRPHAERTESGGAVRFCARDRLHPAATALPDPDQPSPLLVSRQTAAKWRSSFIDRRAIEGSGWWETFLNLLRERDANEWNKSLSDIRTHDIDSNRWNHALAAIQRGGRQNLAPPDLGSIGAQSRPRGYIAFIHLDGDGVGKAIDAIAERHGFAGYTAFSEALGQAANQATGWALATAYQGREPKEFTDLETGKKGRALPFEVITVGGDDVILVCTADRGLQVACELSQRFNQVLADQCMERRLLGADELASVPTASAGVVISHDTMPIVQLQRRARELLRSAKRARQRDPGTGGIDFHVVTTPSLDTIDRVRSNEYAVYDEQLADTPMQSRPLTSLTRRPYTLREAEQLLFHAQRLAPELPGSKRADLYLACRGGRMQATLDVFAVHSRLGETARAGLITALSDLASVGSYPFGAPDTDGVYATALPDLLEAMEFIGSEENL